MKKILSCICFACIFCMSACHAQNIADFQHEIMVPCGLSDSGVKDILKRVQKIQITLKNNKDAFDADLFKSLEGLYEGLPKELTHSKDWNRVFYVAAQITNGIYFKLNGEVDNYLKCDIKVSRKVLGDIHKELSDCWKLSGGKSIAVNPHYIDRKLMERESDTYTFSKVRKSISPNAFTDVYGNEVNDEFYDCYRKWVVSQCETYAILSMNGYYKADLLLEQMPYFEGKDMIKGLVQGGCSSSLVSDIRLKMFTITCACVYQFLDKCIDTCDYIYENFDEYYETWWLARINARSHMTFQEWLWTHKDEVV